MHPVAAEQARDRLGRPCASRPPGRRSAPRTGSTTRLSPATDTPPHRRPRDRRHHDAAVAGQLRARRRATAASPSGFGRAVVGPEREHDHPTDGSSRAREDPAHPGCSSAPSRRRRDTPAAERRAGRDPSPPRGCRRSRAPRRRPGLQARTAWAGRTAAVARMPAVSFPTIEFAAFFVVVFILSWALMPHPRAWRPFILVASYFFYGWIDWRWVLLLVGSTLVNTVASQVIARSPSQADPQARPDRGGRRSTSACCASSSTWASSSPRSTTRSTRSASARRCRSCRSCCRSASRSSRSRRSPTSSTSTAARPSAASLGDVAILQAFFPHLVAGPIVRANELLPQLRTPRDPRDGAGRPGPLPDRRRPDQEDRGGRRAGPQHRRPGLRRPLLALRPRRCCSPSTASRPRSTATSPATPTWRSASPCCSASSCRRTSTAPTSRSACRTSGGAGTSRCRAGCATTSTSRSAATAAGARKTYRNLMITMLLGGLWHGAAWTFVIWGGIHGSALSAERWARERFRGFHVADVAGLADHVPRRLPRVDLLPFAGPVDTPST